MKSQKIETGDIVEIEPITRLVESWDETGPIQAVYSEPVIGMILEIKHHQFGMGEGWQNFSEYILLVGEKQLVYEHLDNRRLPFRKI